MNQDKILEILEESLKLLIENDEFLLEKGVHEQAVTHRLAVYLEKELISGGFLTKENRLSVDCEYNKIEDGNNKERQEGSPRKTMRPDIVFHSRGIHANNTFAIESKLATCISTKELIKTIESEDGQKEKIYDKDIDKLKDLKNSPYKYDYAIGINFWRNKPFSEVLLINKAGNIELRKIFCKDKLSYREES